MSSERVAAIVIAIVGVVVTTFAVMAHVDGLKAPGATLIVVGAAWFGIILARNGFRLYSPGQPEPTEAGD